MRWKAILPISIGVALLGVGVILFLDPIVKKVMIQTGQAIFGAKVEIESVDVSLRKASLRVWNLQVADPSAPMRNLFEFETATFDVAFLPLLEKKVIIEESSIQGLKFGRAREASGALPESERVATQAQKAADFLWSKVETFSIDRWERLQKEFDPKRYVNIDDLQSVKVAKEVEKRVDELPKNLQKEIDRIDLEGRKREIEQKLETLQKRSGSNAMVDAAEKLEAIRGLKQDIGSLRSDIEEAKANVIAEIESTRKLVDDVQSAKEDDWQVIQSKLQLPSLGTRSVAKLLFGPSVIDNLSRVLGWVESARRSMPAGKEGPPPPQRGEGRVVEFPRERELPRFLWKKAGLSGELGDAKPLVFEGTLEGVTSNPPLYGKPALFHLDGRGGGRRLLADATIDHTEEEGKESIQAEFSGFPLQGTSFGDPDSLQISIQKGTGALNGHLAFAGENIDGEFQFSGTGLSLEPTLKTSSSSEMVDRLKNSLLSSLSSVDRLRVTVAIGGTFSEPSFKVGSNLDPVISDSMKGALGAEIDKQREALQRELDRLVDDQIGGLERRIEQEKERYLSELISQDKIAEELLKEVQKEAARKAPIPGADRAVEQLKGIFGR